MVLFSKIILKNKPILHKTTANENNTVLSLSTHIDTKKSIDYQTFSNNIITKQNIMKRSMNQSISNLVYLHSGRLDFLFLHE